MRTDKFLLGLGLLLVFAVTGCTNRNRQAKGEEAKDSIECENYDSLLFLVPPGEYSEERELTMEEYKFFCEVTDTVKDRSFSPLTVQTQVVEGINYKFYCRYSAPGRDDNPIHCYLTIFKPLPGQGDPRITDLEEFM